MRVKVWLISVAYWTVQAYEVTSTRAPHQDTSSGPPSCRISLPQNTPGPCLEYRQQKLAGNRRLYQLTKPPTSAPENAPATESNLSDFLTFPVLNMHPQQIESITLANANERTWGLLYKDMGKRNRELVEKTMKLRRFQCFRNFGDYGKLLEYYRRHQHNGSQFDQYFKFLSQEEDFKDIIMSDLWKEDKVFVEQRLAGLNPMSLRKMYLRDYNTKLSKFSVKLNNALERMSGMKTDILQMVQKGTVFMLDYPLIEGLTNVPDILDLNPADSRKMRSSRSPLVVFVSLEDRHTRRYELKALAIQTDPKAGSPLVFPTDGDEWLLAKEEVQQADVTHVEIIEHLLKTHLMMEPICVTIKRTLSEFHPLNELLKWHCRGTLMVNSLGLPSLLKPKGFMHRLFAIGNVGAIELLEKGYSLTSWRDTHFFKNLERRGVDNEVILPYFPYRKDGTIIWKVMNRFAGKYVDLYYPSFHEVEHDNELQNFANELSADGIGPNGGSGMLKGFPRRISTKEQLRNILARIIFIPIQHHAVNYAVTYYAGFVPNMPTKLYDDPRVSKNRFDIERLSLPHVATIQAALTMNLGSLRYDKLFDYWYKMKDTRAARIVQRYHDRLMTRIQDILRARNRQRLQCGHLTYPYFLPQWMPNSIHT